MKTRLTITLADTTLKKIDRIVDRKLATNDHHRYPFGWWSR